MKGIGLLEQAYALEGRLHHSGIRGKYRTLLEQGIVLISKGLEATCDSSESARFRKLLVQAHAARAEDARYGVGALSRSAQRAPTLKDCEEGWQKVAMIVDNARESADKARRLASEVRVSHWKAGRTSRARRFNLAESVLASAQPRLHILHNARLFLWRRLVSGRRIPVRRTSYPGAKPARLKKDQRCNF